MFKFWSKRLDMDQVPCPTNEELRQMAVAASTASDPRRHLFDQLDDACRFKVPGSLVEDELSVIMRVVRADRRAGRVDPQDAGKSDLQLRGEYRPIAERRVRLGLVIAEIGSRNHVDRALPPPAFENEVVSLILAMAVSGNSAS